MDRRTSFIWSIILFDEYFKYGDDANISGYVGTNAEPQCTEFLIFVHSHMPVIKLLDILHN
jgi:hypothetical protein